MSVTLIVAGGTGGHISPGIALAEALLRRDQRVLLLSLERNRAHPDFSTARFPVYFYNAPRIGVHPLFLFRLAVAFWFALRLMRHEGVKRVVGMGGYSILPALLAARVLRIPGYLCEQNAIPGRATTFLARFVRKVFLSFPPASNRLEAFRERLFVVGNPLRSGIVDTAGGERDAKSDDTFRILVLGGSQGARQINAMVRAALDRLDGVSWVLQCGRGNYEELRGELSSYARLELIDFHPRIHELYRRADVLVCRSGAGVLAEAALFGLPMVLVPYPFARDGHQLWNARYFEREGGAVVLDQRDEDAGGLVETLETLRGDPGLCGRMGAAARGLARPDAADEIVGLIGVGF